MLIKKKQLGLKITDLHRRLWVNYLQFNAYDHVNNSSVSYAAVILRETSSSKKKGHLLTKNEMSLCDKDFK